MSPLSIISVVQCRLQYFRIAQVMHCLKNYITRCHKIMFIGLPIVIMILTLNDIIPSTKQSQSNLLMFIFLI